MRTRVGDITFAVPQVREGGFYPQALEKGLRSERALTLALAEMYVQGVSTRKVKAITEQLCGVSISSSAVSQAAGQLDTELAKWRERPLGEYPFLFVDAYYPEGHRDDASRSAKTGRYATSPFWWRWASIQPENGRSWAFPCL
jgi:transposase-like protein